VAGRRSVNERLSGSPKLAEARRGLERNLHDGAQQRLVLASIWLKRATAQTRAASAAPLVDHALDLVQQGLAELRDLAHGLHPAALDQRGLAPALGALVAWAPLPVELQVAPRRATLYFTIAEALTNVFKHAQATHARVTVAVDDGALIADVVDDGIGGASVAAGSGLRGLTDRLDTVGGTLPVDSPRGGPTTIRACAPLRRLATSDASEDVSQEPTASGTLAGGLEQSSAWLPDRRLRGKCRGLVSDSAASGRRSWALPIVAKT